jgi:hypothetical protein
MTTKLGKGNVKSDSDEFAFKIDEGKRKHSFKWDD